VASWRTSGLFGDAEKLAFELADATIGVPVDVSDDLFERLRRHYTTEQLVELGAICALENFRSRFNRIFRVEPNGVYP
jgi:alkylhydroperoxidase family enzyme